MNINLNPFPTLTTERLVLRELNIQDSKEIFQLRSDDSVNKYIGRNKASTIQEAKDFIDKIGLTLQNQQGAYWAIALKPDNVLIGTICYYNFDLENSIAEIGYELSPGYQRQGIMQEAITKVIEYGFGSMKLKVITAEPRKDNASSIKLLERNGFELDKGDGDYAVYILRRSHEFTLSF